MINPFQVTKPVGPSEVIDRDAETGRLIDLAIEGNNARLVAPRRFGKTSLLQRVQVEMDRVGWTPVYVDLLGILSADDFSARIERAYTQQLTGPVARWWAGVRRSLKPTASAGGGPFPASVTVDLSAPSREALVERLDLPRRVHATTDRRIHVVFDEFQELDRLAQRNVDQVLRSVIQHHGVAASYVFAGSQLHMMQMMFSDPQRAFYSQTQRVALHPLADAPLADYITSRFDSTGKSLRPEVLDALLELVRGHPQRAMVAAHALWRVTGDDADLGEWEDARIALMDEVGDELRAAWMAADVAEREVLVLVADGRTPYARATGRSRGGSTVRAVESLSARGVLAEDPGGGRCIVDPLLAEWIRLQRTGS